MEQSILRDHKYNPNLLHQYLREKRPHWQVMRKEFMISTPQNTQSNSEHQVKIWYIYWRKFLRIWIRKNCSYKKKKSKKTEWYLTKGKKKKLQGNQMRLSNDLNHSVSVYQFLTTDRVVNIVITTICLFHISSLNKRFAF